MGIPQSPACTDWCQGHERGASWDVQSGAVTKTCRRLASVEADGERAVVELERFASHDEDGLTVEAVTVHVVALEPLSLSFGAHLAEVIGRMVEIAQRQAAA